MLCAVCVCVCVCVRVCVVVYEVPLLLLSRICFNKTSLLLLFLSSSFFPRYHLEAYNRAANGFDRYDNVLLEKRFQKWVAANPSISRSVPEGVEQSPVEVAKLKRMAELDQVLAASSHVVSA